MRTAIRLRRGVVDRRRRLADQPLFAHCSRGELHTLARWGEEVDVPAGVTLVRERAIAACMLVVVEGSLGRAAGRQSLRPVVAGEWIGAREVLAFAPEPATVTTETSCRLFALGARPVLTFAVRMPGLRATLFPGLDEPTAARRVRELRTSGLAEWRELKIAPPTHATPPAPSWLHAYRVAGARGDTGYAHCSRPSREPSAAPPPSQQDVALSRRALAVVAAAIATGLGISAATIPIPYRSVRGSTVSASEAVDIDGRNATSGTILIPIVDVGRVTLLRALQAWYQDDADVRSTDELLGGRRAADVDRANRRLMEVSGRNAAAAVDTVLADIALDPATVTIDVGDVGGPSAGLAFALVLIDELTPGDLTGGRKLAVTGEIGPDGRIYDVGGVRLKTFAARRAGCTTLVLPLANLADARPVAGAMDLVAVESLGEAVQKLVAAGGAVNG